VDVGTDNETPVTEDYKEGANKFTGRIVKVTIQSGDVKLTDAEKEELAKGTADAAAAHQ
jgi:arylsulfatase